MIKYTLLALALVGAAGAVHAQTAVDPYGRPDGELAATAQPGRLHP